VRGLKMQGKKIVGQVPLEFLHVWLPALAAREFLPRQANIL
jgi:hypothetical protein